MGQQIRRIVPSKETEHEIVVVNSRFIGSLAYAGSVDEARAFIQHVKAKFADATHHVPAFLIGHGQSVIAHCTDDGEPSGTAGRPALAVLQGSGIGDAVVVVTRYFGGTKLGTGGLVRAYGEAVREVLKHASYSEIVLTSLIGIEVEYPYYEPLKRLLAKRAAVIEDESFTERVSLFVRVLDGSEQLLIAELRELTAGRGTAEIMESGCEFRQPIEHQPF